MKFMLLLWGDEGHRERRADRDRRAVRRDEGAARSFYVIECDSFDDALEWAAKVPSAAQGPTEIRPVIPYEEMGIEDTQRPVEARP